MPDKPLPEKLRRRYQVDTVDEMWRKHLTDGNIRTKQWRHLFGMLPSSPRCVNWYTPFAGFGSALMRLIRGPLTLRSVMNPRYCAGCHFFTTQFPSGSEVELTMLFVDVRGSTTIAETMNNTEFNQLMNRFYEATINILVQADAFIDKLVGDVVTALFIPGYTGKDHARKAVEAGQELLRVTGYRRAMCLFLLHVILAFSIQACAARGPEPAAPSGSPGPLETGTAAPAGTAFLQPLTVYLIALEDGGAAGPAVGCGDSVVPVEMLEPRVEDPVRASLEALFSIRQPDYSGRYNALHQSSLQVESVAIEGGEAIIYLSGSLVSGGVCDDPRIAAQLQETVLQFPEIESATIYINDKLLEEWLSQGP